MTTYGPDSIYECEECHEKFLCHNLTSGNTFGAHYWTDGRMTAPMLPRSSGLLKCPHCDHVFDRQAIKEVEKQPWRATSSWSGNQNAKLPLAKEPSARELLACADDDVRFPGRELGIRIWAWWRANDPRREPQSKNAVGMGGWASPIPDPDSKEPESLDEDEFKSNLARILQLLGSDLPSDILMRAEALRELRRFDEASKVLENWHLPESHQFTRDFILRLCKKGDSIVRKLEAGS